VSKIKSAKFFQEIMNLASIWKTLGYALILPNEKIIERVATFLARVMQLNFVAHARKISHE
jgi:hypothetical protein